MEDGMELTCPAGRFTRCVRPTRSVVTARVRVWSYWSDEAHRLVDARPVQSASCMLHQSHAVLSFLPFRPVLNALYLFII